MCLFFDKLTTMELIKILILIIISTSSFSINKNLCEQVSFNNIKKHTRERNQRNIGYCWAFAGTALLEEFLCEKDQTKCGVELSVLDFSRCQFNLGNPQGQTGGSSFIGLFCPNNARGICEEKNAPYSVATGEVCEGHSIVKGELKKIKVRDCGPASLKMMFPDIMKRVEYICKNEKGLPKEEKLLELDALMIMIYYDALPFIKKDFITRSDLKIAALNSKSSQEFIKNLYIPSQCEENRITIPEYEHDEGKLPKEKSATEKIKLLHNKLTRKQSFSLNICANKLTSSFFNTFFGGNNDECGSHELVVNAIEYRDGKCQANLKNSWGRDSELSGWIDLEDLLEQSNSYTYIK